MKSEDVNDVITSLTSFETFDLLCIGDRKPEAVAEMLANQAIALATTTAKRANQIRPSKRLTSA